MSRSIRVELGAQAYEVRVDKGLLDSPQLSALVGGTQAFVLSDANVAPLYLERVRRALRLRPGASAPAVSAAPGDGGS